MADHGHWSWFQLIEPVKNDVHMMADASTASQAYGLEPILHSVLIGGLLVGGALITKSALHKGGSGSQALVPPDKASVRNLFEVFTEGILGLLRPSLGRHTNTYFPLLATIFIYILLMNLSGLVPGFQPATANVNTNAGMALAVFVIYNVQGVRAQGFVPYIKHMCGPVLLLAPLMLVVEIFSHVARPLTLTLRLYGNMFGDHTVMNTFLFTLPNAFVDFVGAAAQILAFGIPVIFIALGMFVSFIQALVFTLLSVIYIALAVEDHH